MMKWFKHDADAGQDAKLRRLILKYGAQGYGIYWYCLELIARNVEKHNLTFELEHDAELIAADFNISHELVQDMMTFMVKLGLFENSGGVITCLKMAKRTDEYTQQLIRNNKNTPDNIPRVSRESPDNIRGIRIEENRKDNIGQKRSRFVPPSVSDVTEYCLSRNNSVSPQAFCDFYSAKGWMIGKNKMKDWKAAVRTWEKSENSSGNDYMKGMK